MSGTLSNLGCKIYMTAVGVAPTDKDELKGWESKSGAGWSTNNVEVNTVDGDGYSESIAIMKKGKDVSMKFIKKYYDTYDKLSKQFHDISTSDEKYYIEIHQLYPTRSDWTGIKGWTQKGFISDFSDGDINTTDAQHYTVVFTPCGKPKPFNGIGQSTGA